MAKYLLDTDVLIDCLNRRPPALALLNGLAHDQHDLGVCSVSVAETYAGLSREEEARADRFFVGLTYYETSMRAAKEAGRYRYEFARQGMILSVADTLIAATAIAENATLITANAKHFPMPEIRLLQHR